MKHLTKLHCNGKLLALSSNIRLRCEVNGSCKHSSLLHYGNNYGSKKFYSTGPRISCAAKSIFSDFYFHFIFTSFLLWKHCQSKSFQLLNLQLFLYFCAKLMSTKWLKASNEPSFCLRHEITTKKLKAVWPKVVFLVVCDPSMNELWVTLTGLCKDLNGSRSLTACS